MSPTLGGIHSDWLDGPKVNSKWQFPAHSDNDAFNVLLGGGYASCHSSGTLGANAIGRQRGASHDLAKRFTDNLHKN